MNENCSGVRIQGKLSHAMKECRLKSFSSYPLHLKKYSEKNPRQWLHGALVAKLRQPR